MRKLRRQVHMIAEQKRRAQIRDGFEALRSELPQTVNRRISKVHILSYSVQYIGYLRESLQACINEVGRLSEENDSMRIALNRLNLGV